MDLTNNYQRLSDVVRPEMLSEEYPKLFSAPQISWLIRNRDCNGLKDCGAVLKVGRKIYLSREKFFDWFYTQRG